MMCLGNPKRNGGSITEFVEAKTKITGVYEITLTDSASLGLGPSLSRILTPGGTTR
jgi:hypothetical protein